MVNFGGGEGGALDRRQQILREALHLFADKGIDGTGLRDIARAVGVTQPTLYHYFASKEELVAALVAEVGQQVERAQLAMIPSIVGEPTLRQGLARLSENLIRSWDHPDQIAFNKVLMSEMPRGGALSQLIDRQVFAPRRAAATRMFEALIAAGKVRDMDPNWLTLQFMGPIIFASMLRNAGHFTDLDRDRMREFMFQHMETMVRGIERTG